MFDQRRNAQPLIRDLIDVQCSASPNSHRMAGHNWRLFPETRWPATRHCPGFLVKAVYIANSVISLALGIYR